MGCKHHQYSEQHSVKYSTMQDVVTTDTAGSEIGEMKS